MNGETGTGGGLCRVRHTLTGLYVALSVGRVRAGAPRPDEARLSLVRRDGAAAFEETVAFRVANAWIALTGDHGVEIEPLEVQG